MWWLSGSSSRVAQSFHGLDHAATTYQLLNGLSPPSSQLFFAEPETNYWHFHLLVAQLVELSERDPLTVVRALNAFSLALLIGLGALSSRHLGRFAMALAMALPLILCNPVGPILRAPSLISSAAAQGPAWATPRPGLLAPITRVPPFAIEERATSLVHKFLNQSSFPLACAIWALLLLLCSLHLEARGWRWLRAALVGFGGWSLALIHPTTCLALGIVLLARAAARGQRLVGLVELAATGVGIFLALPSSIDTVLYGLSASRAGLIASIARLSPVSVPLVLLLWWSRPREGRSSVFWRCAAALIAAGLLIDLPETNQYKFLLLAAIPLGWELARQSGRFTPHRRAVGIAVGASLTATLIGHAALIRGSAWASQEPWVSAGPHLEINAESEPSLAAACSWIRRSTPPDSLLLLRPQRRGASPEAVACERRIAVSIHLGAPPSDRRAQVVRAIDALYTDLDAGGAIETSASTGLQALDLPWPEVVLVITDARGLEPMPDWLELVWRDSGLSVLRLHGLSPATN